MRGAVPISGRRGGSTEVRMKRRLFCHPRVCTCGGGWQCWATGAELEWRVKR